MGLDMTLYRKTCVGPPEWGDATIELKAKDSARDKELRKRARFVIEEVSYWRKANAIHGWFIDNCATGVDECQPIRVEREHLEGLLRVLKEVEADHSKAPELLPTRRGFFFGGYDYDDYYWEYVQRTIGIIEKELNDTEHEMFCVEWEYDASW